MQLPLLTEDFDPLPLREQHYVAALQTKNGELNALARASPETWDRLTPLIRVLGPKNSADALKSLRVKDWIKRVAEAVGDHSCFMDIVRLKPTHPVITTTGTRPVLACLYEAARKRGLQFVPVLPLGHSSKEHERIVHTAVLQDGRGVAVRYAPLGTMVLTTPASLAARALEALETPITQADLLVDLGWIAPDVHIEPDDIADLIVNMMTLGDWRNVVLLGTSMPSSLSCIQEGTVGTLLRREWQLWKKVRAINGTRTPCFGDYAIQNPEPPLDQGGPGMRANIRYSTNDATLIARGSGPFFEEGKRQYLKLCQQLVHRPEFAGPSYSWGDQVIRECAVGLHEPGAQELWRGAGTSHHLRLVTQQLAR